MARPHKPVAVLKVESLTDGRTPMPKGLVDDFTQEPIPQAVDVSVPRVMQSAQALRDAQNRAELERKRRLLASVGIIKTPQAQPTLAERMIRARPFRRI